MSGEQAGAAPFAAHVELLHLLLNRRGAVVESIQELLNAQHKPTTSAPDRATMRRQFEDCVFTAAHLARQHTVLRGQLRTAHRASGFIPSTIPAMHNDLIEPAEVMSRGISRWQMTRWPGRNGRIRFAQTLFNVYVIQYLELLVMRLWDAGPDGAGGRLRQAQQLLDLLWKASPSDQPVLVRDVRWLIPVAQSPANERLAPYFDVADLIAGALAEEDRLEINKASVLLAGGHLRSQLRHYMRSEGESLADNSLILRTRRSNALDFALAVQSLVPMLRAYETACHGGDTERRFEMAGAICQGVSPDPELFVNRTDLLGAYTMIEELFVIEDPEGRIVMSPMGQRHVGLMREYASLIVRMAKPLLEDCPRFRPVPGGYSPYGVMYGFSNNLLEHMAAKTSGPDAPARFSLEDVFDERDSGADKLAWVSGWRKAPHISLEVQKLYEYPQQFAEQIFERLEAAFHASSAASARDLAGRAGRLLIATTDDTEGDARAMRMPDLPAKYVLSSDQQLVASGRARLMEQDSLLHDRHEGIYLVSYQTPGGWVAISKDVLTEVLGTGNSARVPELPSPAAGVLRHMCKDLVLPAPATTSQG